MAAVAGGCCCAVPGPGEGSSSWASQASPQPPQSVQSVHDGQYALAEPGSLHSPSRTNAQYLSLSTFATVAAQ